MRNVIELDIRMDPLKSNVRMASRSVCFFFPARPRSSGTTIIATMRQASTTGTCTPNSHRQPR
jgi:hypothetical protein